MKNVEWVDSKIFNRTLEIFPGFLAWALLLLPFILAPFAPIAVAYFILVFNTYWFSKAINIMRHMIKGFQIMQRNMNIDWLERCKALTKNPEEYKKSLWQLYTKSKSKYDHQDWRELDNLHDNYAVLKDWRQIYQVVFVTNCFESFEITDPTYDAIVNSNFPNDKILVVSCGEKRDEVEYTKVSAKLKEKYGNAFFDIMFFLHEDVPGDVIGKGPNLSSAGYKLMEHLGKFHPEIKPEDMLVTTLDADHIVHPEYFSILTYRYIVDANRSRKTYQPIPLMFNNIWDAPAPSRLLAVASSYWQIVESMRPYKLRTFAAHTQSLETLLVSDFWSTKTIVEDGHQFWRTYFAYNGDHEMVPLNMPIYQDCVLAETYWQTMKNQYLQRRRWAWGISDFPYIVKNNLKHPEISIGERLLQTFRHLAGSISWSTATFIIAFSGVPLLFNNTFQDTVLAQNVTLFSSRLFTFAWIGLFANIWVFFILLPPLPPHHKKTRYIGMALQWLIGPIVSIFLSSLPALESQTRLMLGKKLGVFWVTPKVRKSEAKNLK